MGVLNTGGVYKFLRALSNRDISDDRDFVGHFTDLFSKFWQISMSQKQMKIHASNLAGRQTLVSTSMCVEIFH